MFAFLSFAILLLHLFSFTSAAAIDVSSLDKRQSSTARGTSYGGNLHGGTCSFSTYNLPSGIFGTALSAASWNSSANCGGCINIKGKNGKTLTAMIVDQCPDCPPNGLDLFQNAFEQVSTLTDGITSLDWEYHQCPFTTPLQIHMKSGCSKYYFSAQVVGANRRTAKMEYSTDGGKTYKEATVRQPYNFFQVANSGGIGASSAWIRVTSFVGTQVVIPDVAMTSDNIVTASGNYA